MVVSWSEGSNRVVVVAVHTQGVLQAGCMSQHTCCTAHCSGSSWSEAGAVLAASLEGQQLLRMHQQQQLVVVVTVAAAACQHGTVQLQQTVTAAAAPPRPAGS